MKQQLEPEFESAIYKGSVRHRRFTPKQHGFEYPLFMLLLKADEIPRLLRSFWQLGSGPLRWARFRRKDYLGDPEQDLSSAVKTKIAEILGTSTTAVDGDVYLLGQLRYFGLYFSPLNLYYLKQADGFRYMLAEVSNTPWNERHYYLIDLHDTQPHPKAFHVSPFNPMQQTYQWHITPPLAETGKCMVNIQVSDRTESGHKIFDATLTLRRIPLNQTELSRVLLRTPIQTLSIVAGIYWQALRLFFKRAPLYKHPGKAKTETGRGTI
jgi:uncharacterized protein